jgi:antitoxin component YwqK of YwqJK toxin-antitoxin module
MRYLLALLIFLPTLVFAQTNQTDANGLRQGLWQKKQDNGRLIYEGNFKNDKPVGEWKRYHPGGQVKAIIEYKGDTAYTQLFDVWRKKVAEGNYVNQQKEGVWKIYKNGQLTADEEYKHGVKNGKSHQYYDTGEVMEEKEWVNEKEDGDYQVFYKSGEPYMQCKMKLGMRHGLFLVSYENGRQEMVAEYRNNLRHGEWKYFDKEGNLQYTLYYDNGQILNPAVRDSVDNLKMKALEKNKGTIPDPEKFLQDPSEYMMRDQRQR